MKKQAFIVLCIVLVMTAWAVPAQRGLWRVIHLTDGSMVRVELRGDENSHWWEDSIGNRYCSRGRTNFSRGRTKEEGGRRYDTEIWEKIEEKDWSKRRNTRRHSPSSLLLRPSSKYFSTIPLPMEGSGVAPSPRRGLIILASFADRSFKKEHTKELYERMANEEGFKHELGFKGSVHDYFKDQSGGQFLLDFDVVGPVQLSLDYAYYGENDADGQDLRAGEMIAEACKLAAKEVDYANYDWDGDGEVEQVVVLFAGQGEHCCEDAATIWPHEYQLEESDYGRTLRLDNVTISTYACCSELGLGETIDGIGTLCHEFSHCLGIPDMYDTEDHGCFGMSRWDLMDYGCYNDNGFSPCGYTSYERMICGWKQPVVLTNDQEISNMKPLSDGGNTYIIYNANSPNEFYLLENRQQVGWDSALPGSGLLVLHVDEDEGAWIENRVNTDPNHPRCTIFHADNDSGTSLLQLHGDPYPYNDNNSLTALSTPSATVFNKSVRGDYYMPMAITSIAQQNGCVSFQYQTTAAVVSSDGIIFHEHFSGCAGKGGNDGKWSGNIALAAFKADYEGWSGNKSYGANQCAKFGTTSAHGIAVTPSIYLNGEYELSFLAAPWNNEENFIWLDVESGKATIANHVFDRMKSQQWNEHHTTITGHGWVKLLFYGNNKRFFLDEVMIRKQGGITTDNAGSVPLNSVNNRAGQIIDGKIREGWFTPDGRKLKGEPAKAGMYIQNGQKIIRRVH